MDDKQIRPGVWLAAGGCLAAVAVTLLLLPTRRSSHAPGGEQTPPPLTASQTQPLQPDSPSRQPAARAREAEPAVRTPAAEHEPVPYIEGLVFGDIDLREARELMPDNLYWQLGAPTKDEAVLEAREQEKKRRNEEYGRVLAGDASEEEVRAYYDYRTRVSTDYLEFADFMTRRFRDSLSEQFQGLLELSIKLHTARLAQIPNDLEDALERSRSREKIREDWRRQQQEFGETQTGPADTGR